jgi:hypothetical protein
LFNPIHPSSETAELARPRRLGVMVTLGVLILSAATFVIALDVRGGSKNKYEDRVWQRLTDFEEKVVKPLGQNVRDLFEETLPEAFFGTQLGPGVSSMFTAALIFAGVMLVRRNVLWGVFLFMSIASIAVLGSVPRYFVMLMPLLLAGWVLGVQCVASRFERPAARTVVAMLGLAVIVAPNLVGVFDLVREQRGYTRPKDGFKFVGFRQSYHQGKWAPAYDVARMIQKNVKPNERVFAPEATVLTYLSGRNVYPMGLVLPHEKQKWSQRLRRVAPIFPYVVFPSAIDKLGAGKRLFNDKDELTWSIIRARAITPKRQIATTGGYALSTYVVSGPPKRPPRLSTKDKIAATQPKRRRPATAGSATRPTTVRAATTGKAAGTQPATTAPRRRKYRPPATGAATKQAVPATKGLPRPVDGG